MDHKILQSDETMIKCLKALIPNTMEDFLEDPVDGDHQTWQLEGVCRRDGQNFLKSSCEKYQTKHLEAPTAAKLLPPSKETDVNVGF